jgi:putative Holliday junction resolvase
MNNPSNNYKRILAIDYGLKRIGLALSDPLKTFSYAYKTVPNNSNLYFELAHLILEKDIEKIILGLPFKESGEEALLTKEVKKFKESLEIKFKLEVILFDERYSSSIASEHISQSVFKKSKRKDKSLLDKEAAAVILQDYLNENK